MRQLLAELTKALDEKRDCVFCSIIETRGSTPQKAGASMLVFPDGSQRGTLGGGCVEAEVKQRALRVLVEQGSRAEVLTFNLDDNYGWDDGLICGGRVSILADPLTANGHRTASQNHFRKLAELVDRGQGCTEAIVMSDKPSGLSAGSRYLFDAEGDLVSQVAEREPTEDVVRGLTPVRERPGPSVHRGICYLPVLPRITLLIVGGGHVGQAVAKLASEMDFDIWVLDDREAYANAERFPTAKRRIIGDIGQQLKVLIERDITPSTYCIIVTRGHSHDEEALYHLATTKAGYVGMIGSKRKIKLIFEDLLAKGIPEESLNRVYAPLGFHIGSQTVPEIAVSIVAELIACRNLGRTIPEARIAVKLGKPEA